MNENPEPGTTLGKRSGWTAIEGLSKRAIRWQLLSDAVQHPATLLPLAVSIMSVIYLLLVSPVFGGRPLAAVLLTVSAIVATASFIWRYVFRYAEEYAERAWELLAVQDRERERLEQAELEQRRAVLESRFSRIDSDEGIKALSNLLGEYEQLQSALRRQLDTDPFSMSYLPALSEETYLRGLSVLSDALELMNAAGTPSRERLEREIAELEKGIEASKVDEAQAERLKIKEGTRASYRQRLDMLDQLQLRVDQLLYQAGRCEASLHRTRIELAAIRTGSSETGVDSVVEALQVSINQVKEVQEELKRLGY